MKKSVIRLEITTQEYDQEPWIASTTGGIGTGFVLKDRIIATCAHVAYGAKHITGSFSDDPEIYNFKVVYACPSWDIVLLTTDNEDFWSKVTPLELGPMPMQEDKIKALGFPNSCDNVKTTKGTVASIQYDTSRYSNNGFLSMHIDVEINPGNSGGPILNNAEQVVGMACQNSKGEDMQKAQSYALPVLLIQKTLQNYQLASGLVATVPDLDFSWTPLKNKFQRINLGLADGQQGIMITEVNENLPYTSQLRSGDIIIAVDGKPIFSDGKYLTDFGVRVSWHLIPNLKNIGDNIEFKLLRGGREIQEVIKLEADKRMPKYFKFILPHEEPTFFNYNGCIFSPMQANPNEEFSSITMINYMRKYRTPELLEAIYISQILPSEWANGLENKEVDVIDSVNGVKISHMWDLIDSLSLDKLGHEVKTKQGNKFYIPRMTEEYKAILIERYNLPERFCSADLDPERRAQYFINNFSPSLLAKYHASKKLEYVATKDTPKPELQYMWQSGTGSRSKPKP